MLEPILRQSKSFPIVRLTNLQGEKICWETQADVRSTKTLFHVLPVNFMQVGTANTRVHNSLDQHVPTHDSLRLWGRRTSQFQCAMSSKSKEEYQHLGSQTLTGPSNAYQRKQWNNRWQSPYPSGPTMMRYRNYRGDPNFQPWVFTQFKSRIVKIIASKSEFPKLSNIFQYINDLDEFGKDRMELLPRKTDGPTYRPSTCEVSVP